jgi:glutamine synthetase
MASAKDVIKMIADNEVKFVDFRFTDTRGKEQHVSVPAAMVDDDKFESGHAFDGSSIAGWKGIEASDMLLMPDPDTAVLDPFREESTLNITCDVIEPSDGKGYELDPRSLAKRAEAFLKASGVGDTAFFGPEPEFFIFDGVTWTCDMSGSSVKIKTEEASWSTGIDYEGGNLGHRPAVKGGYFPVPPVDSLQDIRSEMCLILEQMGVPVEVHHHEVAGAGQCEIGTKFSTLTQRADWNQILKYVVMNVAASYGKTQPSCPSLSLATMVQACTATNPSGRTDKTCLQVTAMQDFPTLLFITLAELLSMLVRLMPLRTPVPTATSVSCLALRPL